MWNVKAKVIPVIIGATGTISKSLRHYLSNVKAKYEINELQKNRHIGHCTHTAGSANVKVQNIFHGPYNITCSTNCKCRTPAKYPRNVVCFRYIIVNTLHKGDNRDDDDDDDDNNNNNNNFLLWRCDPTRIMASFLRFSRSHTTTHHSR